MRKNTYGFAHVAILIVVLVLAVAGVTAWRVFSSNNKSGSSSSEAISDITWSFKDGVTWKADGTPPDCPEPLEIPSPVDMSKVTGILFPGQYRGDDYKPHGGFRFDNYTNDDITVTAPLDAVITNGSRYIESGEVQYFFIFITPCGIMYRFDHLLTLSDTFQAIADKLPEPLVGDSRTTVLDDRPTVKAGDIVATSVGFKDSGNTSFDFGVYDLRQKNSTSKNADWQAEHPDENEFGSYGICWLDYLKGEAKSIALALPAAAGESGSASDYCD